MWRPGEPRPSSKQPGGSTPSNAGPSSPPPQPSGGAAKSPAGSGGKGGRNLSSGTLSMKFMQKKAAKEAQAKEDLEKSKADSAARWVIKGARADPADEQGQKSHQGPVFEVEETDPKTQWMGRRSFSGFNVAVQKMWEQNCEKAGLFRPSKRRSEDITDEEMVERFREQGTLPVSGKQPSSKKQKQESGRRVDAGPYGRR